MIDAKRLLDGLLGTSIPGGGSVGDRVDQARGYVQENPLAATAAAGGLGALLLGTKAGRAIGGSTLKMGALAAIAGVAYQAYQKHQAGKEVSSSNEDGGALEAAPADSDFAPEKIMDDEGNFGLALIQAMISAAKADGHIDADEQSKIFDKLDMLDLSSEDKAFVMDALAAPVDAERIAALSKSSAQAIEIYTASVLTIDGVDEAEKVYLSSLAEKLGIDPILKAHVDERAASLSA